MPIYVTGDKNICNAALHYFLSPVTYIVILIIVYSLFLNSSFSNDKTNACVVCLFTCIFRISGIFISENADFFIFMLHTNVVIG